MAVARLLDANVLIAIADPDHIFHQSAHAWLTSQKSLLWASCPLTELAFVRTVSQESYSGRRVSPGGAISMLKAMKNSGHGNHVFWSDDYSITESSSVNGERLAGPKQITDVYLAALALRKKARLATFDRSVAWQCVPGATAALIELIPHRQG